MAIWFDEDDQGLETEFSRDRKTDASSSWNENGLEKLSDESRKLWAENTKWAIDSEELNFLV